MSLPPIKQTKTLIVYGIALVLASVLTLYAVPRLGGPTRTYPPDTGTEATLIMMAITASMALATIYILYRSDPVSNTEDKNE